ncbi:unnamed protein product [Rhizoctonia solani]|nr:unnamed protein product [Rhizoctonia solani]
MQEATPVTINEITKDAPNFGADLEKMSVLLSLAFSRPLDPMTTPAVGVTYENDPELHHEYNRAQLQAALTGAGPGVAVWYEPGKQFLDDDEQRAYWVPCLSRLGSETRKWWEEVMMPCYNQLTVEGLGEGVKKEMLHLQILAVHPDFYRRGVGKTLVRHMLAQSDLQGVASCVETTKETNVLFYAGLGFDTKSEKVIPSPHGDFVMWCMRREPSVGSSG